MKTKLLQRLTPKALLIMLLTPITTLAQKPIKLLEPLPNGTPGGLTEIQASGGAPYDMLNQYASPMIKWIVGVSMGLAVLMIMVAGFQIMLAGGGQGQQAGKDRIISIVIGIIILVFSATLLVMLNAEFFSLGI